MKVRFDGMDVTAMVAELQRTAAGRRLVNIYNGDTGESYIFKLDNPGGNNANSSSSSSKEVGAAAAAANNNNNSNKAFFVMESGIRFHPIEHFAADGATMPTPFAAKLRKHLRGLRLEQIKQLGNGDRVVLFQFGVGAAKHAIILELYAKGNIILTDGNYNILALLRSHTYEQDQVQVQVGQVYPVTYATSGMQSSSSSSAANELASNNDGDGTEESSNEGMLLKSPAQMIEWARLQIKTATEKKESKKEKKKKAKAASSGGSGLTLKTLLLKSSSGVSHYGPALLEHCILTANLQPNDPLAAVVHATKQDDDEPAQDHHGTDEETQKTRLVLQESELTHLQNVLLKEGPAIRQALLDASHKETPGYVLYRWKKDSEKTQQEKAEKTKTNGKDNAGDERDNKILVEFQPILLKQHEDAMFDVHATFGAACAAFFGRLQEQRAVLRATAAEASAKAKLEKVRQDQQDRLAALERDIVRQQEEAAAVQQHAEQVDQALLVVNSALDSGMDWDQLEKLVEIEQKQNHNPVALLIHKLELEQDTMVLNLSVGDDDDGDEKTMKVRVLLKETAHANASLLFKKYRASKEKSHNTIENSAKALKAAEETAERKLREAQKRSRTAVITHKRRPAWYEKYHWFITTDNYLVLGGRDAQQNELLVKRFLRPGDAYLHAE